MEQKYITKRVVRACFKCYGIKVISSASVPNKIRNGRC